MQDTVKKDKNHPAALALREYQKRNELSRERLAPRAGIALSTLNKLMSGDIPSEPTLRKIEEALGLRLCASYQEVAHPDLGEYPRSWSNDIVGSYIVIRQNRSLKKHNIINTFPVEFTWCSEKPGVRMLWELDIDGISRREHVGYVSIFSKNGPLSIIRNTGGVYTLTYLNRNEEDCGSIMRGIYCGLGQTDRINKSILTQFVVYVRPGLLNFDFDRQVWPGSSGHAELSSFLRDIDGNYAYMVPPPEVRSS